VLTNVPSKVTINPQEMTGVAFFIWQINAIGESKTNSIEAIQAVE